MEDSDGDDEIAAAMGFSSFGHSRKRKYDQTGSPKAKADPSGANMTQLGVRPKAMVDGEGAGFDLAAETVDSIEAADGVGNAPQPESHAPTSDASTNAKAKGRQKQKQKQPAATGLAAFLSFGQTLPEKPPNPPAANTFHDVPTARPVARVDPAASEMVSFGGEPISRAELSALRSGVRVENGDTAYFLSSFVEDPWERMKSRE